MVPEEKFNPESPDPIYIWDTIYSLTFDTNLTLIHLTQRFQGLIEEQGKFQADFPPERRRDPVLANPYNYDTVAVVDGYRLENEYEHRERQKRLAHKRKKAQKNQTKLVKKIIKQGPVNKPLDEMKGAIEAWAKSNDMHVVWSPSTEK